MTSPNMDQLEWLVNELQTCDGVSRPHVAQQLMAYRTAVIEPLRPLLSHPNWAVRYWVARTYSWLGDLEALRALAIREPDEEDHSVREVISNALRAPRAPSHEKASAYAVVSHTSATPYRGASTPVALRPPYSRQQLDWSIFEQSGDGEWRLVLRPYYTQLLSIRYPDIMEISHTGWRDTHAGNHKFAFFKGLSEEDVARIQAFLSAYRQLVIVGLNDHIKPYFSDELDACMCLDFNLTQMESGGFERTQVGTLEYRAKYQQSVEAREDLVERLDASMGWMPVANTVNQSVPAVLTYIPPQESKVFHLPRELARGLARRIDPGQRALTLIEATITGPKASLKESSFEQKIAEWGRIIGSETIHLTGTVSGSMVFVLDDLYQSGVTMWTYARYLKSVGARWVFGLACVKSLRDTDNV